jgi:acyl-CoA synthetase (AMP-forming)/AMP-acid ligase II
VALKADRTKETFLLFLALQALGAISLLTDAHLSIQDYLAKEKIHLKPAFQIEKDSQGQLRLSDTKGHQVPLIFSQKTNPDAKPFSEICSQDGSVGTILIHTSGSTGKAKGVFLSQEAFIRNSQDTFALADYRPDDVALAFLPFHHVFGLALGITALVNQHSLFFPSVDSKSTDSNIMPVQVRPEAPARKKPSLGSAQGKVFSYVVSDFRNRTVWQCHWHPDGTAAILAVPWLPRSDRSRWHSDSR